MAIFILVSVLIASIIYLSHYFLQRRKRNPFLRMNCTEISTDPKLTNDEIHVLLHDDFNPSKVTGVKWDAIVIGSGISGLTLSKILAASDYRVLVLEQHDTAGGSCHTFKLDQFQFDVGLHYVPNMFPGQDSYRICTAVTDSNCKWQKFDDPVDVVIINDKRYERTSGSLSHFKNLLKQWFPNESQQIENFFKYALQCVGQRKWYFIVKFMPTKFLEKLIKFNILNKFTNIAECASENLYDVMSRYDLSPELQSVLSYYNINYGVAPKRASFFQHMLFFLPNAFFPIGGANVLTSSIIRSINKFGGKVLAKANVREINFSAEKKVTGVTVDYGNELVFISANIVVSTAALYRTLNELIPKSIAVTSTMYRKVNELYDKDSIKISGLQAYIGLKGTNVDLKLASNNYFWFKTNDVSESERYLALKTIDEVIDYGCPPMCFISFPSAKDPEWNSKYPNISTCQVISAANPEWFADFRDAGDARSNKRRYKDEYIRVKNTLGNFLVSKVIEIFPHLENEIIFEEFSTPLSQKHFIQNAFGEFYSMAHSVDRFSLNNWCYLRSKTEFPGFYCSGQDVFFCGISSALHNGLLTASVILNRSNMYKDLHSACST